MTEGFQWLESVNCGTNSTEDLTKVNLPKIYPNPVQQGDLVFLKNWQKVEIYSIIGQLEMEINAQSFSTESLGTGIYFIRGKVDGKFVTQQLVIL